MRVHNIAFMACGAGQFARAFAALRAIDAGNIWELMFFEPPPEWLPPGFQGRPAPSRVQGAFTLFSSSLSSPYDRIVIVCDDRAAVERDQLLLGFASRLRAGQHLVVEVSSADGIPTPFAAAGALSQAMVVAVLNWLIRPLTRELRWWHIRSMRAVAAGITRLGLIIWRGDSPEDGGRPAGGRVAILVPILPDLSHTFVYREVIELVRRHPDYLVITLERGDSTVQHPEAQRLSSVARTVPVLKDARYLAFYIGCWLRRPRAMATLVRGLARHSASFGPGARAGNVDTLLDLQFVGHTNHGSSGLLLAALLRDLRVSYAHVYGSTYPALRAFVAHHAIGLSYSVSTFVDFDYDVPFRMLDDKFGRARFVVACTDFCRRRLSEKLPHLHERLRLLRHSIPQGYATGAQLRPRDGSSRLVFVGRLVAKKGLLLLIEVCAILKRRQVPFTAHIYGAGPESVQLAAAIAARDLAETVRLEAPVPNDRFLTLMNHDDIFVCTSREMTDGDRDGIPVTLMEAMSAGITVVGTAISGIPELIQHGDNGYLVQAEDPTAYADQVEALLASPETREAVRSGAIETVTTRFTTEVVIGALEGWLNQETPLAGGTPSPERHPEVECV